MVLPPPATARGGVVGENHPHFHFLVAARDADLAPEHRGAGIVALRAEYRDPDAALAVAAGVRAALQP